MVQYTRYPEKPQRLAELQVLQVLEKYLHVWWASRLGKASAGGGVTVGRSAFGVVSARIRRALLTNARFYLAGRILSPALIWDNYISSYF